MYILCIETTSNICSVCICQDANIMAKQIIQIEKTHAEKLTTIIDQLCAHININLNQIDAVSISKGPGSYTGLRIASSTAKGICYALDIPLLAISTLEIIAAQTNHTFGQIVDYQIIIPLIDARRMEVFFGVYDRNNVELSRANNEILAESSYSELLSKNKIIFAGSGAEKAKEIIKHKNALFIQNHIVDIDNMARLSHKKYVEGKFEAISTFEPDYVKEFYFGK